MSDTIFLSDLVNTHDFSELCDEMYWDGGYSSRAVDRWLLARVPEAHTLVIDTDPYCAYRDTEKGLS